MQDDNVLGNILTYKHILLVVTGASPTHCQGSLCSVIYQQEIWTRQQVINMNTPSGRPLANLSILDLIWMAAKPAVLPTWEWPWTEAVSVNAVLPETTNRARQLRKKHQIPPPSVTLYHILSLVEFLTFLAGGFWSINHYHMEFQALYICFTLGFCSFI